MSNSNTFSSVYLGGLISLEYGKALESSLRTGEGISVYGSGGVVGKHGVGLVAGPGIIVGRKGSVGSVYWSSGSFWPIDTAYYVAQVHEGVSYDRWLYWLLNWLPLKNLDSSTGIPGLSRGDVYRLHVPRPTFLEQCRIAEVLDAVNESIGASVVCVDKLSQLREAALAELIGRGFVLAQKGLEQGVGVNSYDDSLGGVVDGDRWRLLRCADVLKLAGGSPALIDESLEGGFAVYGGNGVIGYTDRPLVGGDVLIIGRVGQYSGAVYHSSLPVWVTDNALYSKMIYGDWDKRFLALYFKWFDLRKSQSLNDNPLVTQDSISRVPVAQPPLKEQNRIVSIIEAHDERIAAEKARLEKLRKLKAGLMDDLLTGRVRVDQLDELPV